MSKKKHSGTAVEVNDTLPPIDFDQADHEVATFRTRYGRHLRVQLDLSGEEPLTKQAFKDESDINNIVNKYLRTGVLPDNSRAAFAQYGDFSTLPDYQTSLNTVIAAENAFSELPSALRNRFNNNPGELLAFLGDSSNRDEAIKLGLIPAPQEPSPGERSDPPAAVLPASKSSPKAKNGDSTGDEA